MQRRREIIAVTVSIALGLVIVQLTAPSCTPDRGRAADGAPPAITGARARAVVDGDVRGVGACVPSLADAAERVLPSVVSISTKTIVHVPEGHPFEPSFEPEVHAPSAYGSLRAREVGRPGWGRSGPEGHEATSLGSGVVLSRDGVVVTNDHVVRGADHVEVTLADGRTLEARVVGRDPSSDVAVLRLVRAPDDLVPATLGESRALRLGELVLAVGNPFGVGQTVTFGIVSAKGRADLGIEDYEDFIQTDAAINPGSSGGALVDLQGRLVGLNTAILSRSGGHQGIGFAIPTEMVQPIAEQLLRHGRVVRGWLGISTQEASPALAEALDLSGVRGVVVTDVPDGTPGAAAGLREGDVIVALDGEAITTAGTLRNDIARRGAGARVRLTIVRAGVERTLRATVRERPDDGTHPAPTTTLRRAAPPSSSDLER
ncbi:trypsin-like peptidase domain-containing protein, partial [Myxococcota bacterium]|nr:trypsin-like peptidase domain-containing protein [Myxococcota bacterium]